jgi:hypothetical protein
VIKLNLPEFFFQWKETEKGTLLFDSIRKKWLVLTPEEWVRQNFIRYLIEEKKYPPSLLSIESGLIYNRLQKRSDIRVYDRKGKVWMIVECKEPNVKISQKVFNQVALYNSATNTKANYLAVTNGLKHYCCVYQPSLNEYKLINTFPDYMK